MPPPRKDICDCTTLERAANDPKCPIEFDAELNEYHITRGSLNDYMLVYYCPFCGGTTPKSRRHRLFHTLTTGEQRRLIALTKNLRTVDQVIAAFGQPDVDQPVGAIKVIPERDGKPEITESYRVMIYTKLSDTANVHVTVYPMDKVSFRFQGKAVKKDAA